MTLRIVTDSTCDLPREAIQALGITVVPLSILFGDEELMDGVDIQTEQFFRRLERDPHMPTTAQPAPALFARAYQRLIDEGATEILSIHLSEKLSGTFESARLGAEGIEGARIERLDSGSVSLGLGIGVMEAAKAARGGKGLDVAILPIGDLFTMGPDDAIEAIRLLKPTLALPSHYGTWPPIEQDAAAWAKEVAAAGVGAAKVLTPGDSVTLA